MDHLYHLNGDYIYLRADALNWGACTRQFPTAIEGEKMLTILENIVKKNIDKHLLIDNIRISSFDINAIRGLKYKLETLSYNKDIIFIRNPLTNLKQLFSEANFIAHDSENSTTVIANIHNLIHEKSQFIKIEKDYHDFCKTTFSKIIESTFKYHKVGDASHFERLFSTPLESNGEFDAGKIISNPKDFIFISLSCADHLHEYLKNNNLDNQNSTKLLSVSLRASPFASAIANTLNYELFTIDHLGPNHRLLNIDFNKNVFYNNTYIYIGDFLIGGTEIKIAQNYIHLLNGSLTHAFVLASYFSNTDSIFQKKINFTSIISLKDFLNFKIRF